MEYAESNISQGRDSHSGVVRCLSFNRSGSLIASGGDDNSVKIWDVKGGKLKFHIEGHSPALSLVWTPDPHILVVGFEDNVVVTIIITEASLDVHGIFLPETQRRPAYPIESLALNTDTLGPTIKLAAGGHQRVRIWNLLEGTLYQWAGGHELGDPYSNGINDGQRILVTGLEWLDRSRLLVSYMFHGLICWNSDEHVTLFTIPIPSSIGRMALSPDHQTVAIYNMGNGVDIWDIRKSERRQTCKIPEMGKNFPLPVVFLHNGSAVASGNMKGRVAFWDVRTGQLIDELIHLGESVHAISSFYFHDKDKDQDRFLIATAAANVGQHKIRFWEASSRSAMASIKQRSKPRDHGPNPVHPLPTQRQERYVNCLFSSLGIMAIVVIGVYLGIQ